MHFNTLDKTQHPLQPTNFNRGYLAHTTLHATSTCGTVCVVHILARPTAGAFTTWKVTSTNKSESQGISKAKVLPR